LILRPAVGLSVKLIPSGAAESEEFGGQVTSYSTIRQDASYDKDISNRSDDLA